MATSTPQGRRLNISADGRHFVGPDGLPAFFLGDTLWELFRLFEPDEAAEILQTRAAQGFNAALVMLLGVDTTHVEGIRPGHENLHDELPWVDGDPARPNEKYFQHVDRIIAAARPTGVTLIIGVYHQWHWETIPPAKAEAWARWVAARYRDVPDLVWCMYPRAEERFCAVCRQLAAGLRAGDGGTHLISMHPDPSVASSSFMNDDAWLDFHMIQTCMQFDRIADTVWADRALRPARPVVMAEGGYEGTEFGRTQTAHDIRKQAYWTQLAGGYHVYGHNDNYAHPRDWRMWLVTPGVASLGVFRTVITGLPAWHTLTPAQEVLGTAAGTGFGRHVAARAADGRWTCVYFSEPASAELALPAAGRGEWVNPTDGSRHNAGSMAARQSIATPAGWEDALLIVTHM